MSPGPAGRSGASQAWNRAEPVPRVQQNGGMLAAALILALLAAIVFYAAPPAETLEARGPASLQVENASLPAPGELLVLGNIPAALGRNLDGDLYSLSLRCPYLGCVLRWDEGNRQFHCPCHGDRFARDGSVIAGQSLAHLDRFKLQPAPQGGVELLFSKVFVMVGREQPPDVQYPRSLLELHM